MILCNFYVSLCDIMCFYLVLYKSIFFFDKKNTQINKIVQVKIIEAKGITLHGELFIEMEIAL